MPPIKRFEDIQAWQKARLLVRQIYQARGQGALNRDYGLKDQLCRAAVSSMSNLAEGFARKTDKDFAHSLGVAKGSAIEVQSLLYVALDIGHIGPEQFRELYRSADETAAVIGGFTSYLRRGSRLRTPD